ncbi:MAG: O-methyltransferase [Bacteroidota bacterium]
MEDTLFKEVDAYISSLLAHEDQSLTGATALINSNAIPNASISANQGKFLQVLAIACNAKRILELGTLGAYSTIWLAQSLPKNGKVISIEFDPLHAEVAKRNVTQAGLDEMIEIRQGAAMDILPQLEKERSGPFDMVFIDADKPPYLEYFKWAIRLGRPGTIIVADNVIRNGKVLETDSEDEKVRGVQRLNTWLSECKEVSATILQTVGVKEYDGMVVAVINQV